MSSMRFIAVLNRDGGTLRTADLDALERSMRETLEAHGHMLEVEIVAGDDIVAALERAARRRDIDVVMAGGGDGTISAAAAALNGRKKALAVLPAGTMNLFARGLGIPLGLDEAIVALAAGRISQVDLASVDDRVFVHQFSIGMHPKLIHLRDKMAFGSRLGKISASFRAAFLILRRPPKLHAELDLGDASVSVRASSIGISNNLFGEGHLPYADMPNKGELGIYVTRAWRARDIVRFALHMAAGRWQRNPEVEVHSSGSVTLRVRSKRKLKCSIDGELCDLASVAHVKSLPAALRVLVPASA